MNEGELEKLKSENKSLKAALLLFQSKEETHNYKKFFHLSPDIIIVVNSNYLYEHIHIPNIPQTVLDGLVGKDIVSTTPETFREKMVEALGKVFKNKETVVYESEGDSMGEYKYYLNYLTPIFDENKIVTHCYFLSRDISIQKKSELKRQSLELNLDTLFQSMKHVFTIFDVNQNVIWFNGESKRITKFIFNKDISIGMNTREVFPAPLLENFTVQFENAKSGIPVKYIRKYNFEKNEDLVVEFSLLPIIENNKLLAIAHVGIDVTELALKEENSKKLNQELIFQNQQLNQYSNIISHNLRGPISTLMGIANVIDTYKEDKLLVDKLLGEVKQITQKLDTVLQDLNLILNHTDHDNSIRQEVDLNLLFEDIKEMLVIDKLNQVSIITDFDEAASLFTIKGYLHSILFNLVSNAVKYKKINEEVVIKIKTYKTSENKICIEVSDNGLGIDLEIYGEKLFGFYKRFHNHVEGKGIGLHMSKSQIELMGGNIEVESKANVGSVFKVYLPIN